MATGDESGLAGAGPLDGTPSDSKSASCPERTSNLVIRGLENLFYRIGYGVALYPIPVMVACVLFSLLSASGMSQFYEETNPENLFVPSGTQILEDSDWIEENFPGLPRFENVIITADDILQPEVVQAIYDIDATFKNIRADDGSYSWESLCYRLGDACWSNSILELWSFDETVIASLTRDDILTAVNTVTISPVTSAPIEITNYIGGLTRDANGDITGAEATLLSYVLFNNDTDFTNGPLTLLALEFEAEFIDIASGMAEDYDTTVNDVYYFTQRSQSDEGGGAIFDDLVLLVGGYALLAAFVVLVLGQFNMVYHRVWATLGGLLCVVLSILVSLGLSSWAGLFFGPLHNVLPFLVLGLGVDDMFIIAQALDTLPEQYWEAPVHVRMAHALKHAGVSITVTSFTDIVAFGVGATTRIPALSSFCLYVCIAIFAVFVFQSTFFVAVLSIDERRSDLHKDACCCCFVHHDYRPAACSRRSCVQMFFDKVYTAVISQTPVKVHVVLITFIMLAANVSGLILLQQDFDINWFIPSDSYASAYINTRDLYFPQDGWPTAIYLGDVDYYGDFSVLEQLCEDLRTDPYIQEGSVDCWITAYDQWLSTTDNTPLTNPDGFPINGTVFYDLLQTFLDTPSGFRFQSNTFVYNTVDGVQYIQACKIPMHHIELPSATEEIHAMDSLYAVAESTGFQHEDCFAYAFAYGDWEGNRVIREELYRNLGLAVLCVLGMTLVLLANIWVCVLVLTCVLFTLVDVCGMLYFWGLTIDTVTSVNLIIAVGLAVDYSAHIAHTFMTLKGSKEVRMARTMSLIAPAVFYGGFSTLLAFILLAGSTSYVFKTFFKVFLGVTVFGLFHGLAYLPVLLSWVGPRPYLSARETDSGKSPEVTYATHISRRPENQLNEDPHLPKTMPFSHGKPSTNWMFPRPKVINLTRGDARSQPVRHQPAPAVFHTAPHAYRAPPLPGLDKLHRSRQALQHPQTLNNSVLDTGFDSVWTAPR